MWTSFSAQRDLALDIDGLHSTRSVEYDVVSPADTQGMFDRLTYEKGASILRMLEQYLGDETYRDGIRNYLRKHSYANTVTTDLWDAIEEVSGEPVRDVMNTWILQGGYPLDHPGGRGDLARYPSPTERRAARAPSVRRGRCR